VALRCRHCVYLRNVGVGKPNGTLKENMITGTLKRTDGHMAASIVSL